MTAAEPLIVRVIQHFHPDWEPPNDTGREWQKTLCPFHGESNPSASVSFSLNAFNCFACDVKGDAFGIIMREEEISYREAVEYAEKIAPGSNVGVPRKPAGKPGRRAFGEQGAAATGGQGRNRQVPSGVRRRPSPWA